MLMYRSSLLGILFGAFGALFLIAFQIYSQPIVSPLTSNQFKHPQLYEYSFPRLHTTYFEPSTIYINKELDIRQPDNVIVREFTYTDPIAKKKVSGTMTLPDEPGEYPLIMMMRGYVEKEEYYQGIGTRRASIEYAKNGYITLAPDFLGYGTSDEAARDSLESRFQTYTSAVSLYHSVEKLNDAFASSTLFKGYSVDPKRIGMWGHSNGGHIALSTLAITGDNIPTVLWAPVSAGFPDAILTYTEDMDDGGSYLKSIVADFTSSGHNIKQYSYRNYLRWIHTDIQLHQGGADDFVPLEWGNSLKKDASFDLNVYTYPEEDHNFRQGSFDTMMRRDLEFFKSEL